MNYITDLVRAELSGDVKSNELTDALTAYKLALGAGLTVEEASRFAEAVYAEAVGIELASSKSISLLKTFDRKGGQSTFTVTVNGKSTTSNNLIELFRTTEGLTIMASKRLVDSINSQNPYSKEGLTRTQAEELANRIREAGGSVTYFQSK
jgi:large subunit ribosomal protein L7/L12